MIKKEPTDESLSKDDNDEDQISMIPENVIVKLEEFPEEMSPSAVSNEQQKKSPRSLNNSPSDTQKYCSTCDIVFTYENTLAAHKKFYCKGIKNERPSSNGPSPNSNVSMAAETTVL
jgi:hypothetical protein